MACCCVYFAFCFIYLVFVLLFLSGFFLFVYLLYQHFSFDYCIQIIRIAEYTGNDWQYIEYTFIYPRLIAIFVKTIISVLTPVYICCYHTGIFSYLDIYNPTTGCIYIYQIVTCLGLYKLAHVLRSPVGANWLFGLIQSH